MQNVHSIQDRSKKQFVFEVELNWWVKKRGFLSASSVNNTLHVATPQEFGGEDREWSPEQLFFVFYQQLFYEHLSFLCEKIEF